MHQTKRCGKRHPFCAVCRPDVVDRVNRGPKAWPLQSCGSYHAHCKECRPDVALAVAKTVGQRKTIEEILDTKGRFSRHIVLAHMLDDGIWENKCILCGLGPEWRGENLVLQIDHRNGDSTDNRVDNLRLLCPNCHTQTPTYGNRKRDVLCPA